MGLFSGSGGSPTGTAGGSLAGTYPNPSIAAGAVSGTEVASAIKDAAAGTASMRTLSTTGVSACAGNDSRLADSRAPNGAAGGGLAGTYPSPTIASSALLGIPVLIFRYTVAGADKSSIDTGVDTPDAGSNVWTGGDLIEAFLYSRTDEVVEVSQVKWNINNDTGANYDMQRLGGQGASAFAASNLAQTKGFFDSVGTSAASGVFCSAKITIPNYAGIVGNKAAIVEAATPTQSSFAELVASSVAWRSTAAITRLAFAIVSSSQKFKIGTQLLIYKRTSS